MIRPQFQHSGLRVGAGFENGLGEPDFIVETALGLVNFLAGLGAVEDVPEHVLGGALAHRTGHAEPQAVRKFLTLRGGKSQVGGSRVIDQNGSGVFGQPVQSVFAVDQNGGGAVSFDGFAREGIAVESLPAQGHVQPAAHGRARIGEVAGDLQFRAAAQDFSIG